MKLHALDVRLPLERFELDVRFESDATTVGVFGPSGAGKTSLLEAVAGLRSGTSGHVRIAGETWLDSSRGICLAPERRDVGYLPQGATLFPHLDARGNIETGARRTRAAGRDFDAIFATAVEMLELTPFLAQSAATLSGGERQRVALARAICSSPSLLVLDEPLASVDAGLRMRLLPFLRRVRDELGIPMLVVSHSPFEIAALCEHVVVLDSGRIVASGSPSSVLSKIYVDGRAGNEPLRSVFAIDVISSDVGRSKVRLRGTTVDVVVPTIRGPVASHGVVAIPADAVMLSLERLHGISAANRISGEIGAIDIGAGSAIVHLEIADDHPPLLVEVLPQTVERLGLAEGREVHAIFKASACEVAG